MASSILMAQNPLTQAIEGISHQGELRLGAIRSKDSEGTKATTLSMGGKVSLETKALSGFSLVGTFFSTNPLFGKKDEGMFLSSQNQGYTIVGESYLKANFGKTMIKAGRQLLESPYANGDDSAMIPNTFEGYSLMNQDIKDSTIILALLDKWSGIDSPKPEQFNEMQNSKDAVFMTGIIYDGIKNTTLEAWHYRLDDANFNYGELSYEANSFYMALQYTDQEQSNTAYGIALGGDMENLNLEFAYNKVNGVVSNGFGGGPFFTSCEDHTIADVEDQKAMRYGAEYALNRLSLGISYLDLEKGENETDYLASFEINQDHTLDLIYTDMNDDGSVVRFFANYNF